MERSRQKRQKVPFRLNCLKITIKEDQDSYIQRPVPPREINLEGTALLILKFLRNKWDLDLKFPLEHRGYCD